MLQKKSFKCNLSCERLLQDELNVIEKRMHLENHNEKGFIQKIYNADKLLLESININYDQIINKFEFIWNKYQEILHNEYELIGMNSKNILVNGKYLIESILDTHVLTQQCGFQNKENDNNDYEYEIKNITITNIENNMSFSFNALSMHMIICHHFFGNPKSPHRLDPQRIIKVLEIKPKI